MARGKTKTPQHDPHDALIDAAMRLAARIRWQDIRMRDIADEAGMPLAEALQIFASRSALLSGMGAVINGAVLADLAADSELGETVKDRLFDILMRRFDAMAPYKPGLASLGAALSRDPCALLCRMPEVHCAMALSLEAADVSASGPWGRLRVHGLSAVYLNALRVWFRDDSPDMAKTMAAVDRGLTMADRVMAQCRRSDGPGENADTAV